MNKKVKFELLKVGFCNHLECIAMRAGRVELVEFPALCGLIEHPEKGFMLYDTGYSDHFEKAAEGFPECLYKYATPIQLPFEEKLEIQLHRRGIQRRDISYILISHFHADHIAGLKDFPEAKFISAESEYRSLQKMNSFERLFRAVLSDLIPQDFERRAEFMETKKTFDLPKNLSPFTAGFDLFEDESVIGINLPGHTESQMGILFRDQEEKLNFLVGDAVWGMDALLQDKKPSDLARNVFYNQEQYDQTFDSLRKLFFTPESPRLIPSHCDKTWKQIQKEISDRKQSLASASL